MRVRDPNRSDIVGSEVHNTFTYPDVLSRF